VWIGSEIPPIMKSVMDKIKNENPEFNVECFDDEKSKQFLSYYFDKDVLDAYHKLIPGSYKSDLVRFALLYVNGGIYLDAKMEPINNFKFISLTDKEYYLCDDNINYISSYNGVNANVSTQIIVSKPKNKILMDCIQQIVVNTRNDFYGVHPNEVTGPGVLHKYLLENNISERGLKLEFINGNDFYFITKYPFGEENAILKQNNSVYSEQATNGIKGKHHHQFWNEKNVYLL
jgi:mannosyltransferase OCH1-like enzyme